MQLQLNRFSPLSTALTAFTACFVSEENFDLFKNFPSAYD